MRKYLIAALIAAIAGSATWAQPREKRGMKPHDRLKTELSLNDEQYASIKDVNKKFHQRQMALKRDSTLTQEQKLAERKRNITERDKEINAVLSLEQQEKWQALNKQREERSRDRKDARQRFKQELSLSDEQSSAIKKANREMHGKLKVLRIDSSPARDVERAEVKRIRDEHNAKIKSILSDEQYQKWNALRKEHGTRHHRKRQN